MSDVETDIKREEEQRREEDERLDTAEDERRGDDGTEEVRRAFQPSRHSVSTAQHAHNTTERDLLATKERLTMDDRRRSQP
jgi:hypothetical protein